MNLTLKTNFLYVFILIASLFVGFSDCKAQVSNINFQNLSTYQGSVASVTQPNRPISKRENWKLVSTTNSVNSDSYKGYIKRPYHNPNLIREKEAQLIQQKQANAEAELLKQKEKEEQLSKIAANFYRTRRNHNGYVNYTPNVSNRKITSRVVMPFNEFKTACKKYYNENKLIKSSQD